VELKTYHQVSYDDGGQEEGDADLGGDDHAVPHGLDPLSAEDPEDNFTNILWAAFAPIFFCH